MCQEETTEPSAGYEPINLRSILTDDPLYNGNSSLLSPFFVSPVFIN